LLTDIETAAVYELQKDYTNNNFYYINEPDNKIAFYSEQKGPFNTNLTIALGIYANSEYIYVSYDNTNFIFNLLYI